MELLEAYPADEPAIVRLRHCVSLEFNSQQNLVVDLSRGIYSRMTTDEIESAVWSEYTRFFGEDPYP